MRYLSVYRDSGYYHQFVSHFSELAKPLVRLLTKDAPFYWGEEPGSSFRALMNALTTLLVLVITTLISLFILFTNASVVAVGSILAQHDKNKVNHPIAYYSKTLSKAERNYSVTEREYLDVLLAIKHSHPFLYGTYFTLVTEHSSLKWLQQTKDPDGRLAQWALKLHHQDFTITTLPSNTGLAPSTKTPKVYFINHRLPSLALKITNCFKFLVAPTYDT